MRFLRREIFADGQRLEVAGHPVRLKVSARARQISLRVDRVNREVTAVAPTARRLADAADFARERQAWIAAQLTALPLPQSLAIGDEISLFGQPCRLETGTGRARLVPATQAAPARIINCGRDDLDLWMAGRVIRREADKVFAQRVGHHCAALGAPLPSVKTADASGRWGSCTPARVERRAAIRLSWRLALAPFAVADYVVAHEVAHLREANHGPRFWALVHDLIGDPKPHRAWLRAEGPRLHAFGR